MTGNSKDWVIGVIGGSGFYAMDGVEDGQWINVESGFGTPSDAVFVGRLCGVRFVFLPRHGRGHAIPPGALNARANIDVLKRCGVTDIVAVSAIGSLREDYAPGDFVIVNQFVDRTKGRAASFFETGCVAHVSMADPVCARLSGALGKALDQTGGKWHDGATYLAMEGPQFSTRAESRLYRQWGCDVIGMTAMPEAKLAREAELPYALVGMVTDYDCWRNEDAAVHVDDVLSVMRANTVRAHAAIRQFAVNLPSEREASSIDTVLDVSMITPPAARDPEVMARLSAIAGRVAKA